MSHHHYSDGQVGEEREFYSSEETSDGEREYYEHVRTPRASVLNSAVTVSAIVLILGIAFGYRASIVPAPRPAAAAIIDKITTEPASDACTDVSSYPGREC